MFGSGFVGAKHSLFGSRRVGRPNVMVGLGLDTGCLYVEPELDGGRWNGGSCWRSGVLVSGGVVHERLLFSKGKKGWMWRILVSGMLGNDGTRTIGRIFFKLEVIGYSWTFEFHSFVASWSVNVQKHVSSTLILLVQMLLSTMSWTFLAVATSEFQCNYSFRVNVDSKL